MGEKRGIYRVLVGRPEGKRLLGTPRWIILILIFSKWAVGVWVGFSWRRIGTSGWRALVTAVRNLQVP